MKLGEEVGEINSGWIQSLSTRNAVERLTHHRRLRSKYIAKRSNPSMKM